MAQYDIVFRYRVQDGNVPTYLKGPDFYVVSSPPSFRYCTRSSRSTHQLSDCEFSSRRSCLLDLSYFLIATDSGQDLGGCFRDFSSDCHTFDVIYGVADVQCCNWDDEAFTSYQRWRVYGSSATKERSNRH